MAYTPTNRWWCICRVSRVLRYPRNQGQEALVSGERLTWEQEWTSQRERPAPLPCSGQTLLLSYSIAISFFPQYLSFLLTKPCFCSCWKAGSSPSPEDGPMLSSDSLNFFDWLVGGQTYPRKQKGKQAGLQAENDFALCWKKRCLRRALSCVCPPWWGCSHEGGEMLPAKLHVTRGEPRPTQHKDPQSSNARVTCWANPETSYLQTGGLWHESTVGAAVSGCWSWRHLLGWISLPSSPPSTLSSLKDF